MPQKVMLKEILEDATATEIPTQEEINRFRESTMENYLLSDNEIIIELTKEKKQKKNGGTTATVEVLNKDTIEDFLSQAGITPLFFKIFVLIRSAWAKTTNIENGRLDPTFPVFISM